MSNLAEKLLFVFTLSETYTQFFVLSRLINVYGLGLPYAFTIEKTGYLGNTWTQRTAKLLGCFLKIDWFYNEKKEKVREREREQSIERLMYNFILFWVIFILSCVLFTAANTGLVSKLLLSDKIKIC